MDSNAIRQTQAAIKPGHSVIINLGLDGPLRGVPRLSPQDRIGLYVDTLREVMQYWSSTVEPGTVDQPEDTLVVKGVFADCAPESLLLWDMVCAAEQDCISIYYVFEDYGYLYGPSLEGWGEFDKQFLKGLPND